ncbi:hypothetical protein PIROE2DRAFT_19300 [Piromyces sp. E2]|nr:hypothetical protein PIROE2DRAFT_19300 [Piromyces sp. E2]|eukprot:OUM56198.1 hypothetical protein PIROE2DRAFT_19300 [Piromyces sp. E2]
MLMNNQFQINNNNNNNEIINERVNIGHTFSPYYREFTDTEYHEIRFIQDKGDSFY